MKNTTSAQERASLLFRAAGRAEALSPERLEVVWARTRAGIAWGVRVRVVTTVAVAVTVGLAALWWSSSRVAAQAAGALAMKPGPLPDAVATAQQPRWPAHAEPVAVVAPPVVVEPVSFAVASVAPAVSPAVRVKKRAVPIEPVEAAVEDPLLAESRLLARAVAQLREERDPAASLSTLEAYDRRFGRTGVLKNEATLTHVEALVAGGRRAEARALLERIDLAFAPRGGELRVLLGELLFEAGEVEGARAQFEFALESHLVRDADERARWGRAETSSGAAGLRQALDDYLEKYPDGRFAPAARERLAPE